MYQFLMQQLEKRSKPVDIIVSGLGFMGFGFLDGSFKLPNFRIALLLSRRPGDSQSFLESHGYKAEVVNTVAEIETNKEKGTISISDNLGLIHEFENEIVIEMTGTIAYGTEVALRTIEAGKHLLTMNPELQVTVGTQLKKLADKKGVLISDVYGDQPGSLARLITNAQMMGCKVLVAGNMKRYRDNYATQEKMKPWAEDKGLAVRQTVSFTDGTKQAIEMNLVANYFKMDILQEGMKGIKIENIMEAINSYSDDKIPESGVVDYALGKTLFPGVFCIVEHPSPHQKKYLRYLGLGDGPRYTIFDSYHLCHLEVASSAAQLLFMKTPIINNSTTPVMRTVTFAKKALKKGDKLDGVGGDTVRGDICRLADSDGYLPVGLSGDAVLKRDIAMDEKIKLEDVELAKNKATELFLSDKS